MTKQCKCVLKNLRVLTHGTECDFCYVLGKNEFCLFCDITVIYDFSKYQHEIGGIISVLIDLGCVEQSSAPHTFHLTHKALHPYEFTWNEIKGFLFRSVLVPVVVSFATSLLTWLFFH